MSTRKLFGVRGPELLTIVMGIARFFPNRAWPARGVACIVNVGLATVAEALNAMLPFEEKLPHTGAFPPAVVSMRSAIQRQRLTISAPPFCGPSRHPHSA